MDDPAFVLKAGSPVFGRTFSWPDGVGRPGYRVDPRPVNYAQALSGRGYRGPVGPPGGHIQIPALPVDLPAGAPPDAVADARIAAWVWAPEAWPPSAVHPLPSCGQDRPKQAFASTSSDAFPDDRR